MQTIRLTRDGEKDGGGGMEGGGRLYTYTVTTRMTPALRWAAMKAILMFHNCEGQSHTTKSTDHNLFEEKGEQKRYRTEVLPLTSPTNALPLGQTGSHRQLYSARLLNVCDLASPKPARLQ